VGYFDIYYWHVAVMIDVNTKAIFQDTHCSGQDSYSEPPKYATGVLILTLQCSVGALNTESYRRRRYIGCASQQVHV
jgi:hypothetical protein